MANRPPVSFSLWPPRATFVGATVVIGGYIAKRLTRIEEQKGVIRRKEHDVSVDAQHNMQRKAALANGGAKDHVGAVVSVPDDSFDLDATIFKALSGSVPRLNQRAKLGIKHFWNDYNNFLIYGGAKEYLGYNKRSVSNVYIRVDLNHAVQVCAIDHSKNANDIFADNICTTASGNLYSWRLTGCDPDSLNVSVDVSYNNQFYSDTGKAEIKCANETWTLSQYQDRGYDIGSTENTMPSVDQVIAWGRHMIDLPAKVQTFVV